MACRCWPWPRTLALISYSARRAPHGSVATRTESSIFVLPPLQPGAKRSVIALSRLSISDARAMRVRACCLVADVGCGSSAGRSSQLMGQEWPLANASVPGGRRSHPELAAFTTCERTPALTTFAVYTCGACDCAIRGARSNGPGEGN